MQASLVQTGLVQASQAHAEDHALRNNLLRFQAAGTFGTQGRPV
jgi:hypothetical protein